MNVEDNFHFVAFVFDGQGSRSIFGSNWPVCLVAASYAQVYDALSEVLGDVAADERSLIFGANAISAYRLAL